jgi:cell division protease FtsH
MEETSNLGYSYGGGRDFSEKYAEIIDEEIKTIIEDSYKVAKKVLKENEKSVKKLVALLLEREVVTKEEFNSLFE